MERKFRITVDGRAYEVTVEELTDTTNLLYPPQAPLTAAPASAAAPSLAAAGPGDVVSTLGGVVERIAVAVGQMVRQGEEIVIVQAMKMNTPMVAPRAGRVAAIAVKPGEPVVAGQVLATIA